MVYASRKGEIRRVRELIRKVVNVDAHDNIGKDMVLKMMFEEKEIKPGEMLPKTSKIDLVLGNGNRPNE